MIYLKDIIKADYVAFLETTDKDATLNELIHLMDNSENILDKEKFREAVFQREQIVSTGIGLGMAIPHVKIKEVADITIGIGIVRKGIDWNAIDNKPVHVVFLIAASDEQHEKYLRILAKIVLVMKNQSRREKLLKAESAEEVISLFENV